MKKLKELIREGRCNGITAVLDGWVNNGEYEWKYFYDQFEDKKTVVHPPHVQANLLEALRSMIQIFESHFIPSGRSLVDTRTNHQISFKYKEQLEVLKEYLNFIKILKKSKGKMITTITPICVAKFEEMIHNLMFPMALELVMCRVMEGFWVLKNKNLFLKDGTFINDPIEENILIALTYLTALERAYNNHRLSAKSQKGMTFEEIPEKEAKEELKSKLFRVVGRPGGYTINVDRAVFDQMIMEIVTQIMKDEHHQHGYLINNEMGNMKVNIEKCNSIEEHNFSSKPVRKSKFWWPFNNL